MRQAKRQCVSGLEGTQAHDTTECVDANMGMVQPLALADMDAHWEGYDSCETDEEEYEFTDNEDEADVEPARNAFDKMMLAVQQKDPLATENRTVGLYQRASKFSDRHARRLRAEAKELQQEAKSCRSLSDYGFTKAPPETPATPLSKRAALRQRQEKENNDLHLAIEAMEKKLKSKKEAPCMQGQTRIRHEAVLQFMRLSFAKGSTDTNLDMALTVAKCYGKGSYFARKILQWKHTWILERKIEEGRQGCFSKTASWFNDEGVHLAIREHLAGTKNCNSSPPSGSLRQYTNLMLACTAYGVAKVVGDYLESRRAADMVEQVLISAQSSATGEKSTPRSTRIRARTARRWLKKMGLIHGTVQKGVYVDGHEREDVKNYRNNVFLPKWRELSERFVQFEENGAWKKPNLPEGVSPLVLVTHDESTFNANDGRRKAWMEKNKQPIRPKGQGKGIMVSGKLRINGTLEQASNIDIFKGF